MKALRTRVTLGAIALTTIRARLTLWYVALLALTLVCFSTFVFLTLGRGLYWEIDRALAERAAHVSGVVARQGWPPPVVRTKGSVEIALYDGRGGQIAGSEALAPSLLAGIVRAGAGGMSFATVRDGGGVVWRVLAKPIDIGALSARVLVVARPEDELLSLLQRLKLLLVLAIPLTLVVAVAGGLFLAGRALGPIDRIRKTAERIGAEDLSGRLNLPLRPDEVGRLAATFDRMLERLDQAFRQQRQFTADASHELRTPLTLLMTQAELALERRRTPAEYRDALESIRQEARRMAKLIDDLLLLGRADAGQDVLSRELLDLRDVVTEVGAAVEPLATARRVRIDWTRTDSVVVLGDQTRLTQLLLNLVDNGIKFTSAGGSVTVSVTCEGKSAVLRVADTGIGIPHEHLPRVFERFYRVDPARSRDRGGTGLGLAIARWIVEAHGGGIQVTSTLGRGTTFTVRLPLAAAVREKQALDRT
jgi:heavy metal sensor kinase